MDINEALLFQHISDVLKLLNIFINKNTITSPILLNRLDYLYERLSDFLGRDLNNGWWPDNETVSHFTYFESPSFTIAQWPPKSSVESANSQPPQNIETAKSSWLIPFISSQNDEVSGSNVKSAHIEPPQNVEIAESEFSNVEVESTDSDLQKITDNLLSLCLSPTETADSTEDEPGCKLVESNEEINSNHVLSSSLDVQSNEHQLDTEHRTKSAVVKPKEPKKTIVMEKQRTDLDEYVIQKFTISYLCKMCNVNIFGTIRSHMSKKSHQKNVKKEKDIGIAESETICGKYVSVYHCQLCSVNAPSEEKMVRHLVSQRHLKELQGVPDPNIGISKRGLYYCKLCNTAIKDSYDVNRHLQGKRHTKQLGALTEDKVPL